jgi:hypothetical protein
VLRRRLSGNVFSGFELLKKFGARFEINIVVRPFEIERRITGVCSTGMESS